MIRTSATHPLRVDCLPAGAAGGQIGLTFCPGKTQPQAMTGIWARDLDVDLGAIQAWGATHLLTLIEPFEFEELKVPELGPRTQALGMMWHHAPIVDDSVPDVRFDDAWASGGPVLRDAVARGERVVIHCKGGLGRAGTVAGRLLMEIEPLLSPNEALARVRDARPGAVYVPEQEAYLRRWHALREHA